jgi:hypothetical protein
MGGSAWDVGRPFEELSGSAGRVGRPELSAWVENGEMIRRAFCGLCQHRFTEDEDVLLHMDEHVDPNVRREREREMTGDLQELLGELRG